MEIVNNFIICWMEETWKIGNLSSRPSVDCFWNFEGIVFSFLSSSFLWMADDFNLVGLYNRRNRKVFGAGLLGYSPRLYEGSSHIRFFPSFFYSFFFSHYACEVVIGSIIKDWNGSGWIVLHFLSHIFLEYLLFAINAFKWVFEYRFHPENLVSSIWRQLMNAVRNAA